jgi:homoserine O-succinyltransferase
VATSAEAVAVDRERGNPAQPGLRVGIVNIMPKAETYERLLLQPLHRSAFRVEPVWLRLQSHRYASSDARHIHERYATFENSTARGPLDGVILTGAPVEELPFAEVHYWTELSTLLRAWRASATCVVGLCWGGLALAQLLGIDKRRFDKKLFGVFEERALASGLALAGSSTELFRCAHSRHSGIGDEGLEAARDAGAIRLLSHGPETGYSIFESADGTYLAHLGHPEYEPARLVLEWQRDAALGRSDVDPPRHFDPARPVHDWQNHCDAFFAYWLGRIAERRVDRWGPPSIGRASGRP